MEVQAPLICVSSLIASEITLMCVKLSVSCVMESYSCFLYVLLLIFGHRAVKFCIQSYLAKRKKKSLEIPRENVFAVSSIQPNCHSETTK